MDRRRVLPGMARQRTSGKAAPAEHSVNSSGGGRRILVARAPLRLDLAGDGTDMEAYSRRYGGLTINVTINKFVYVVVTPTGDQPSQMSSSSEFVSLLGVNRAGAAQPDLAVAQAVLQRFGMSTGVSVFVAMQVPAGTGLGSSTASGLALACALGAANNKHMAASEVAELVATIKVDELNQPNRRQNAYAIALGGLTGSRFTGQSVCPERIEVSRAVWRELEKRLILFYTGRPQDWEPIWAEEKKAAERNRASVIESLHLIKREAEQLLRQLQEGKLDGLGSCFDATWQAKKRLARNVSDAWIDQWYQTALDAGASGGKLCGVGGGGFLLVSCEPTRQDRVSQALEAAGLVRVDFQLEPNGASLLTHRELDWRASEMAAHKPDHVSSN